MKSKRIILVSILLILIPIPSCEPDKKMLVETGDVSNISTTTADVSGTVIDVGEGATQHGHCYGTGVNPTISGTKTALGIAAAGDFTSNLTGLEPSTTYHVRAYASLGAEAAYGSEVTFTTASAALPELTTTAITSITKTSAVSGGNITSEGGTAVTARGVCWNVAPGPTTSDSKTSNGTGSGSFASSITGLSANTTYYVRAYATNTGGTAYGNEISFTTSPEVAVAPTVTTVEVTIITSNSAVSGGDVTNEGGAPVTAKGVCWSTTANPTITSSKTTDGTGSGSYVSDLTNLNPGTTYYVRAYATNSAGISYGNEYNFKTTVVVPTLTTVEISAITNTTASSGGSITSDGGAPVTARGVCWSTSTNPTTADNKTNDGLGSGLYTSNLTNLTGNTTYYVRAYATNSAGTAYGNELSFNTGAIVPTLTTTAVTTITSTTATSGGDISSDGGSSVTAKGVCWSTSANPTTADSKTSDGTGTDPFTSSITGLTPGTTYHVRAYATNSIGTGYGEDITFTIGAVIPAVSTTAISAITSTAASSGGNVTSDGGASVTVRGVCWSTTANPTVADSKTTDGIGTGIFTSSITGLTPGGTYHVRAYATNSVGTAYGEDLTFTAGAVLATVTTTEITDITSSTASSGGNVTSDGGVSVTARGVCWSISANPTIVNSKTTNGSGIGSFTSSLTGLSPNTTYYIRAYATSSAGTGYGNELQFNTLCIAPTAITNAASGMSTASATLNGTVNANDFSTTVGFEWGLNTSYSSIAIATQSPVTGSTNTSVSAWITGLTPNTTYHYRVKAVNCEGTPVYGDDQQFTTKCIAPTATTDAASGIGSTTANLNGTVNAYGFSTTVTFEWGETTGYGSTATATQSPVGGSINTAVSAGLIGLTPDKTYHYRVKAINCEGTPVYGGDQAFTTKCVAPIATTNAASGIGTMTSTLNGTVNANSFSTTVTFEWGLSTSYGSLATAIQSPVTGTTNIAVSAGLTELTSNTTYHYRVSAVNCEGTAIYGGDQQFRTLCSAPVVNTNSPTGVTTTTATLMGIVNPNDANTVVTFEYGLTTSYGIEILALESPIEGANNISVSANITGLTANSSYHFRAKAVNEGGTTYGNDLTFTTTGTITDIDGNIYNTVIIGTQIWMKENLRTTKYNDGVALILTTDNTQWSNGTVQYCWYNNDEATYKNIYGAIYQGGLAQSSKLCPSGWHVPSDAELTVLTDYLTNNGFGFEGSGEDIAKSLAFTSGWTSSTTIGTPGNNQTSNNKSGFSALPGGYRDYATGGFSGLGSSSSWWSSTSSGTYMGWYRYLGYNSVNVIRSGDYKEYLPAGRYIRCLKD